MTGCFHLCNVCIEVDLVRYLPRGARGHWGRSCTRCWHLSCRRPLRRWTCSCRSWSACCSLRGASCSPDLGWLAEEGCGGTRDTAVTRVRTDSPAGGATPRRPHPLPTSSPSMEHTRIFPPCLNLPSCCFSLWLSSWSPVPQPRPDNNTHEMFRTKSNETIPMTFWPLPKVIN